MARSIIQGTLALLLILVFIYDCKDSGGVQADQLKELEKTEEWNLPSEIEQPNWRIVREAGKKIVNGSKNKKTEKERKNKKNKTNSSKKNKKIRQGLFEAKKVKPNKRKSKNKTKKKKNKARRNKKKLRRNKKRSRKNRKMLRQRKDKSKKIKNKAKHQKKKIDKGRRKSTHQKKKIGKGRRKSTHKKKKIGKGRRKLTHPKKKTNIIYRMETKQTCNEKELEGKIKLYIRISNQLRKAKRITKFCDLMERKAEKSLTTFNETVAALNKSLKCLESSSGRRTYLSRFNWRRFSRSIRDDTCLLELTGERDILENCRKTAYAKCETSSVEGCQNATHRTECEKKLQDWLNKFGPAKGSCLQVSDNYCSCITALPDVPPDCLKFDKPEKSVKAAKNKCTRSDEEGSFGFCKKLQLEAAIIISKCETCTSGVNNCTQSTSTPGVVTTTRKHTSGSSKICQDKDVLEFKHKAALHFDEIHVNLTSSNSRSRQCLPSSCQPLCKLSEFLECGQLLLSAMHKCALDGLDGIRACMESELNTPKNRKCIPCVCKAIFIQYSKLTPGCINCDGCPSVCPASDLIVTAGDNSGTRLENSELVSATGVCSTESPRHVPNLPDKVTGGQSVWVKNTLVFCGGSRKFKAFTGPLKDWGASSLCYSLQPGSNTWSSVTITNMNQKRAWFSLTVINNNQIPEDMIAVGGIDENGLALKTMEKYNFDQATWTPLTPDLNNAKFGHCAVNYNSGDTSYVIIIGGSGTEPVGESWQPTNTVLKINVMTGVQAPLNNLPVSLWGPACTIVNNRYMYVTGGSTGSQREAQRNVYRYDFEAADPPSWITLPNALNEARWGHVMGHTSNIQLVVAGGFNPDTEEFYKSVENSNNFGNTWKIRDTSSLTDGREYAAAAEVPSGTFTC